MARSRRTRASRALLGFVVASVAIGSIFQFHHLRKAAAAMGTAKADTPPAATAATAANPGTSGLALKPTGLTTVTDATMPKSSTGFIPQVNALVSQTPGGPGGASGFAAPTIPTTNPSSNFSQISARVSGGTSAVSFAPSTPAAKPQVAMSTGSVSSHPFADAKAKQDPGDLLSARKMLNDALIAGGLSDADTDSAKKQIAAINQILIFGPKHFADDPFGGTYTVKPGQRLASIASENDITWELLLRLNGMTDPKKLRAGQSLKIVRGPFHVVVSKSKFTMDVYLGSPGDAGSMYITTYGVGLGRDDSTPTGTWMVEPHHKIKHPTYYSPRGEGVIAADDPKNPLGPFWLGLSGTDGHAVGKASYGIHGTIEPDSIGKMASMGCIRMHNEDVAVVYELLVEGKSTVVVKD